MTFFKSFPKTSIDLFDDGQKYNILNTFRYVKVPNKLINDYLSYTTYNIINGERPEIVSYKLYGTTDYYWTFFIINDFLKNSYSNWMLSTRKLQEFVDLYLMDTIVNTRPIQILNADGLLLRIENTVTNNFDIVNKEPVRGLLSGATGNVIDYDNSLQQLRITNVDGNFFPNEIIIGDNTGDKLLTYEVFKLYSAPCEYVDSDGVVQNNLLFFKDGVTNTNLTPISYYEKLQQENEEKSNIRVISPELIIDFVKEFKRIINN